MPFEERRPKFTVGRPLTPLILHALRDQAFESWRVRYSGLSDGIVAGCDLFEENGAIGVQDGIVKFGGGIYTLSGRHSAPYQAGDGWSVLKLAFRPPRENQDFAIREADLILAPGANLAANELEMGRFKLREGFRLRTKYEDFADMLTEYDTALLTYTQFAAMGEYTLNPKITHAFAREAYPLLLSGGGGLGGEREKAGWLADMAFCAACLASDAPIRREYLQTYVQGRFGEPYRRLENEAIHRRLTEILTAIKSGKPLTGGGPPERRTVRLL
jgi:hypothetical protein